ncbi:hypothetical protein POM88_036681 [Heracleum sosnowskyi]|uniref:rRNA N-glycosylase n=1 Tax=Heracleum sosnowskyi TaxID=360622 RepID=A0AAD8HQ82_9APIA|nr:hypothetical protein POM88_036681 [Heracleum sosnowskyi]
MSLVTFALVGAWLIMSNGISIESPDATGKLYNRAPPPPPPQSYPVQTFRLSGSTSHSYAELINNIRSMLAMNEVEPVHQIPRLRQTPEHVNRQFILIRLINTNEDTITVALNTITLYLVGFRTRNEFYYFPDTKEHVDTLFPELLPDHHHVLPFGSSYGALANEAGERRKINLGMEELERAIQDLQEYRRGSLARAFTVIVQMIPEAIRFSYIQNYIGHDLINRTRSSAPSATMIDLDNQWGSLSSTIQNSRGTALTPAVVITDCCGQPITITNVTPGLVLNMGIMLYVCIQFLPSSQLTSTSNIPLHSDRGNISEHFIHLSVEKGRHMKAPAGDVCKIVEPTVRIVGRNGLRAEVKDGKYNDGNAVRLWRCKSNQDVNQLWTLWNHPF